MTAMGAADFLSMPIRSAINSRSPARHSPLSPKIVLKNMVRGQYGPPVAASGVVATAAKRNVAPDSNRNVCRAEIADRQLALAGVPFLPAHGKRARATHDGDRDPVRRTPFVLFRNTTVRNLEPTASSSIFSPRKAFRELRRKGSGSVMKWAS